MSRPSIKEFLRTDNGLLLMIAGAKLAIHLVTNALGGYGIFRDELYYFACSERPSTGYVDQPPFSIYLLILSRFLFGDSLFALRILPAVAGAATVFLTGLIVRQYGGGRWAQTLAASASAFSLINMGTDTIFQMNAFDILLWTVSFWLLAEIILHGTNRHWLLLGIVLGLGLLNKISVLWLGAGIAVGLLFTPERRWLRTPWPYVAACIAGMIFLPYIVWNITHGLAHLEFIRNASGGKYSGLTPISFALGQIPINNPVSVLLWLPGYLALLFASGLRRFRIFGIVYSTAFLVLVANGHSKAEYLSAAYAPLFAAGGVLVERLGSRAGWRLVRPIGLVLLIVTGVVLAPVVLPILPVHTYIAYAEKLGIAPASPEGIRLGKLPQFYADMFGWAEKARAVAQVYRRLTPDEQARCAIYAQNYGRSAAIDYFGRAYGLPKAIGNHNSYWVWGPGTYTGEIMIVIGGNTDDLRRRFDSVEVATTVHTEYCIPYENDIPIHLCRHINTPLRDLWPENRHYE
jgi:hypothetical protein